MRTFSASHSGWVVRAVPQRGVKPAMKESDAINNPEMEVLRNILLGDERRELDDLRRELSESLQASEVTSTKLAELADETERMRARSSDPDVFLEAAAGALPDALRRAGQDNPSALSRALSPFVVTSIRKEIANSRDEMVDALYPITGRLVAASVRNSIAKLSEDINERVDSLTSMAMWKARVQAWRTGEPVSKFLLTTGGEFHVLRAMLLDRGAGTPLSVAEADDVAERSDTNLISGLLAALSNLTEEVYTSAADELRRVDLNGRQIAFRRSASQLLVIEFVGQPAAEVLSDIDRRFADIVSLGERDDQAALDTEVSALLDLESTARSPAQESKPAFAKWAFIVFAVLALGWLAGSAVARWQLNRAVDNMQAVIDRNALLTAFPISIEADHDDKSLVVQGLLPRTVSETALRQTLIEQAGSIPVNITLQSVADQQAVLRAETQVAELRAENGELRRSLATLSQRLSAGDVDKWPASIQRLNERVEKMASVFNGATEQLQATVPGLVIKFGDGLSLRDADAADAQLKQLALLLLQTPEDLLIVPQLNPDSPDSVRWPEARAHYVRTQLLRFGVPASQLRIVAPVVAESPGLVQAVAFGLSERSVSE